MVKVGMSAVMARRRANPVTLIRMGREFGYAKLATVVEQEFDPAAGDVAAIRHLLMSDS
jgi:hypothetical protein